MQVRNFGLGQQAEVLMDFSNVGREPARTPKLYGLKIVSTTPLKPSDRKWEDSELGQINVVKNSWVLIALFEAFVATPGRNSCVSEPQGFRSLPILPLADSTALTFRTAEASARRWNRLSAVFAFFHIRSASRNLRGDPFQ